jgi:hypothetical protein
MEFATASALAVAALILLLEWVLEQHPLGLHRGDATPADKVARQFNV